MTTVNNPKVSPSSGKDENPKEQGFLNRSRASDKTLWDWLQLLGVLAIPLVVAGATLLFGIQQANLANQQHDNDQKIAIYQHDADRQQALDQQRQATLVTYQDNMKDLLLHQGLLTSKPTDEIRVIARTETLSAMRQLDGKRNSFLLQFLQDAHLIGFHSDNIVSFVEADLSSTDLNGANLSYANLLVANLNGANLSYANLSYANLLVANLNGANLSHANLLGANLNGAFLSDANLSGAGFNEAKLSNAKLSGADLSGAFLKGALSLTQKQLDQVYSCKDAILPPGLTCHHNTL